MLATSIVDIVDWLLLRGLLHRRPIFHPWLENIRDEKLKRFPGLYEVKAGVLVEFLIMGLLIWGIVVI